MTTYLNSVFKVLYRTQPGTEEKMGVSAEELAQVTAEQAFEDADLDHDGKLSFDEFNRWYTASGPMGGEPDVEDEDEDEDEDEGDYDEDDEDDDGNIAMGLEDTIDYLGLAAFSPDDVLEVFAEA